MISQEEKAHYAFIRGPESNVNSTQSDDDIDLANRQPLDEPNVPTPAANHQKQKIKRLQRQLNLEKKRNQKVTSRLRNAQDENDDLHDQLKHAKRKNRTLYNTQYKRDARNNKKKKPKYGSRGGRSKRTRQRITKECNKNINYATDNEVKDGVRDQIIEQNASRALRNPKLTKKYTKNVHGDIKATAKEYRKSETNILNNIMGMSDTNMSYRQKLRDQFHRSGTRDGRERKDQSNK